MSSVRALTAEERAALDAAERLPDEEIDTSDMPEVLDWSHARRGLFYKPIKRQLTLRIDADVIAWFQDQAGDAGGYQTRMNAALREYMERHATKAAE